MLQTGDSRRNQQNQLNQKNAGESKTSSIAKSTDSQAGEHQVTKKAKRPLLTANNSSRHPWEPLIRDGQQWIAHHPLTIISSFLFLLINIIPRIIFSTPVDLSLAQTTDRLGFLQSSYENIMQGRWYTVLTAVFFVDDSWQILLGLIIILTMMSVAESRLGRRLTVVISIVSMLIGLSSGLALCFAFQGHRKRWAILYVMSQSYGPCVLVIGAFMAAAIMMTPLWRRRVYIYTYAVIAATLLYRGEPVDYALLVSAFVGQAYGFIVSRLSLRDFDAQPAQTAETWHILGIVTLISACGPLISATSPIHAGPFSQLSFLVSSAQISTRNLAPCMMAGGSRASCYLRYGFFHVNSFSHILVSLLSVLVMVLIARGIYRGRLLAVDLAIIFNTAMVIIADLYYFIFPFLLLKIDPNNKNLKVSSLIQGSLRELIATCVLPLTLLIIYAFQRRNFTIVTRRRRKVIGGAVIVASFLLLCLIYVIIAKTTGGQHRQWESDVFNGGWPRARRPYGDYQRQYRYSSWSSTHPDAASILEIVLSLTYYFLPTGFLKILRHLHFTFLSPLTQMTGAVFGPLLWVIIVVVVAVCLSDTGVVGVSEHRKADQIVELGGESMSFMTTWQGNSYWFSSSGRSAIAYRVYAGIALTVTGPFGDPSEYEQSVNDFIQFCQNRSWTPVFYSIHQELTEFLEKKHWSSLDVGTEMIIDPTQWKTTGKKWQDIRTAINKAKRENITDVLSTYQDSTLDIQSQIMGISEAWSGQKALPEMGFTLGSVKELMDPRVKLLYAVDPRGVVQAVTSWLPTYRQGRVIGWTLDFMRHRPDASNGIMEFLIARMAERLRDGQGGPDMQNVEFMSLSAAPLSGIRASDSASASLTHLLQMTANILEPAYGFHSLLFFKKKFKPHQAHVYVAYPDSSKLGQIALAVGHAYLPSVKVKDLFAMAGSLTRHAHPAEQSTANGKQES